MINIRKVEIITLLPFFIEMLQYDCAPRFIQNVLRSSLLHVNKTKKNCIKFLSKKTFESIIYIYHYCKKYCVYVRSTASNTC